MSTKRKTDTAAVRPEVEAAEREGLLDRRVLPLPIERWPQWARARYAAEPVGPVLGEPVEPWTVSEAEDAG